MSFLYACHAIFLRNIFSNLCTSMIVWLNYGLFLVSSKFSPPHSKQQQQQKKPSSLTTTQQKLLGEASLQWFLFQTQTFISYCANNETKKKRKKRNDVNSILLCLLPCDMRTSLWRHFTGLLHPVNILEWNVISPGDPRKMFSRFVQPEAEILFYTITRE